MRMPKPHGEAMFRYYFDSCSLRLLEYPSIRPRRGGAEMSQPCCVLSEFLPHRIREHHHIIISSLGFGIRCYIEVITRADFGTRMRCCHSFRPSSGQNPEGPRREEAWQASGRPSMRALRKLERVLEAGGKETGDLY